MQVKDAEEAVAKLEIEPPPRLAVGRGNAFVIGGYCYHPRGRTRSLEVELAGQRQPVDRFSLARRDVFESAARTGDGGYAFRSGFVAMPTIGPVQEVGELELGLVLSLSTGEEYRVALGSVAVAPALVPPVPAEAAWPGEGPRVAICMATFNPPVELLRRQLQSVREQSHRNWVCFISDDRSGEEFFAALQAEVAGDPRFTLSRSDQRLGFYRNFERALSMAPADAEYVTLCDQDDRWHPNKLEGLLERIDDDIELVYSDARVIRPSGELMHSSYWTERRNNHTNFTSLLLANSVTGASSLFRRDLLDDALPFPQRLARPFHDHWLAIVALARGEIGYIDRPLYDYVQHEGAVIGHATANKKPKSVRRHLAERLRNPTDGARRVYYYDWYQQLLFAEVLRLRCWERMSAGKRRALRRLLSADRSMIGLSWLLGRRVRRLWGHDETLDRELFYAHALARRRAMRLATLGRRRPGRLTRDERIPSPPYPPTSA
jgi:glycosyltransferase involved in cell wall biosynthesis